ncbi:MAG: glycerol-3-phosphate 1-O-acyltransferase PlsY [Clostridia bacterium]|nr:glycerol-3-phosphate 1-O-acyltransferase PlsY [Clostridia bacterium]
MTWNEICYFGIVGKLTQTDEGVNLLWIYGAALVCMVIAYFLGSLNFAIIISKARFGEDIRTKGSGNAGLTNMLRTYGKIPALMTLLGDMLKAALSVYIGLFAAGERGAYLAAFACMIGHCFPAYYNFRGGKGVLVAATSILCLEPMVFAFVIIIFIIMVAFLRYVSLGSITAAFMYPILLSKMYGMIHHLPNGTIPIIPLLVSILISLTIIIQHHENIKRLREGTENKLSFHKKKDNEKNEK